MNADSPSFLVISPRDPRSVRNWSGTPYFMTKALERRCGRVAAAPVASPRGLELFQILRRFRALTARRQFLPFHTERFSRYAARRLRRLVAAERPDVVLCVANSAILPGAPRGVRAIYSSDATLRLMLEYYPNFSSLAPSAVAEAEALEKATFGRADLILFPTRWAARSAIEDYGVDPARIRIVPYGANIAEPPEAAAPRSRGAAQPFRLLFVGVDWVRKGGPVALDAFRALRARGYDVSFSIVGCSPPGLSDEPGLNVVSFIDKSIPEEYQKYKEIFGNSDLLILPSRSECYGIVFCEAAAYGLPSVAPGTGGIPDVVLDGETGRILPADADGQAYADAVAELIDDPDRLGAMRRASRRRYEEELNWDVWARRVVDCASDLLDGA